MFIIYLMVDDFWEAILLGTEAHRGYVTEGRIRTCAINLLIKGYSRVLLVDPG